MKGREIFYFDKHYDKGMKWYKNQFLEKPDSSYIIGDKGPDYMLHPTIAERVHKNFPKIKLIVVLRNPIDRSNSQFWFNKRRNLEPIETFEEAILCEPELIAGEIEKQIADPFYISWKHRRSSYLARSRYAEQLERWLALFPRDQLLVVNASDIRQEPQKTMNTVFSYLGLKPFSVSTENAEKNSDYPVMNPETRKSLIEYFKPYNEQLEQLLDCKFNWDK